MNGRITIFAFAGSLRKDSFNKALLRTAADLLPNDAEMEIFDLEGIPPFNQDLENEPPAPVIEFKRKIKAANALLIVTPEYNYSIPGVLKNAIDWASRPYAENAFANKPVAFMGASIGMLGTARAQYHLRQSCVFLNLHPLNQPEVMVPFVNEKVDRSGRITDEKTKTRVQDLLQALIVWARKFQEESAGSFGRG